MLLSTFVKKNLKIALPLALNALLMQSMLLIDTLLISPLGEVSVAALGICVTIMGFLFGIQGAIANGSQLIIGRAFGTKECAPLFKALMCGIIINLGFSLVAWLTLFVFKHPIIQHLTHPPELQTLIEHYLSISIYILPLSGFTQACIAFFNGTGKTSTPLKGYILEMPINILCSYLFIHGTPFFTGLGVQGAALGSLIAICFRMLYISIQIKKESLSFPPELQTFIWLYTELPKHLLEVFPIAINLIILTIGAMLYQLIYAQLPVPAYAAITLVFPWIRIGGQFITAWALSSAICISQDIGAQNFTQLQADIKQSIKIAALGSCVISLLFFCIHYNIHSIYPYLSQETYVALSVIAPLYIFLPVIRGFNTIHGHVLRALGRTTDAFKINFTGQWLISLPLLAMLIFYFDISLFWAFAIQPFEELIKALPFHRYLWKHMQRFR